MSEKLQVTIPAAAEVLGYGRSTVYDLINAGELKVVKSGRAVRIPMAELRAFVERRTGSAN